MTWNDNRSFGKLFDEIFHEMEMSIGEALSSGSRGGGMCEAMARMCMGTVSR